MLDTIDLVPAGFRTLTVVSALDMAWIAAARQAAEAGTISVMTYEPERPDYSAVTDTITGRRSLSGPGQRSRGGRQSAGRTSQGNEIWLRVQQLRAEGKTWREISVETGVSKPALYSWAKQESGQ